MAERYERLFSNYDKYSFEDAPAILVARALLKDSKKECVVAQLKFQNIISQHIQAVNICIKAFDSFGKEVQGIEEYQYTDLDVAIGEYWGQDVAITLPNDLTRTINVALKSIVFSDNTVWEAKSDKWVLLDNPENLYSALKSEELVKQFKIEYGQKAESIYLEDKGVWHCVCGTINKSESDKCYFCKSNKNALMAYDFDVLQANADARILAEKEAAEEKARIEKEIAERKIAEEKARKEKEEEEKRKKKQKAIKAGLGVLILIIACGLLYGGYCLAEEHIMPVVNYNRAIALHSAGKYEKAILIYEKLETYSDAENKILECKFDYAKNLMENGDYIKAIEYLNELESNEENEGLITECNYHIGKQYIEEKQYLKAIEILSELSYEDSETWLNEAKFLLGQEYFKEKRFNEARELFADVKSLYPEGEKWYVDTAYQIAEQALADKDYKTASINYKICISKLSDAKSKYREAAYYYGLQLVDEKRYEAAVDQFEIAIGYADAKDKKNEAMYAFIKQNKTSENITRIKRHPQY